MLDYKDEHGKRQRRLLSHDKRTAERIANEILQKREMVLGGLASTEGQSRTLEEVKQLYFEDLASRTSLTHQRNARMRIERVLAGVPATRVRDLRVHHVLAHMQSRLGPRTGVRTVNHEALHLKSMLNWAASAGLITQNPLARLKLLPVREDQLRRNRRALSDAEIERFLTAARDDDQVQDARCGALRTITTGSKGSPWEARDRRTRVPQYALWLAFIETGARFFEMTHVRWADLDPVNRTLTFRGSTTKNARTRVIPLREELVQELLALRPTHKRVLGHMPAQTDMVFLNPEGDVWPRSSRGLLRILSRVLSLARIDPKDADGRVIDIHALRHTCASRLARAGVPITQTQRLLGHSTSELTAKFYVHSSLEDLRAALGQVEGATEQYGLRAV
ncbi:MAG: site-specific integrase [Planctomycetes bacterium]|nr:site-specific integrase [Planctomycetota bacterium]